MKCIGCVDARRVRPDADVKQHIRRRRKRKRDKEAKSAAEMVTPEQDPNSAEARSGAEAGISGQDAEAGDEIAPWQVLSLPCALVKQRVALSCVRAWIEHPFWSSCALVKQHLRVALFMLCRGFK